ncbi:SOS response-associated peptidase family protein [Achromobacter animicus]|uniref:SOS response-associated peptidase family protein n=1 Tax=Achromobacter animicus TaxID=1389935 RepID=UPI003C7AB39F
MYDVDATPCIELCGRACDNCHHLPVRAIHRRLAPGQHCIIPAGAIFEPDWRSGKAVATRLTRADVAPLGIAGLWDRYRNAAGQWPESYTMLTLNGSPSPPIRWSPRP